MHRRPIAVLASLALALPVAFLSGPAADAAPVTKPARPYDFDGDGLADLAVGAPMLKDTKFPEGGVAVLGATRTGFGSKARVITPRTADPDASGFADDEFGSAFTSGDFNGDGYADLAVGLPVAYRRYEAAGAVDVFYGSAAGLSGTGSVELLKPDGPEFDTAFGYALVSADFDADGRDDLAVSTPFDYQTDDGSGTVSVFPGAAGGLAQNRSTLIRGKAGTAGQDFDDEFGWTLAVGDLDQNSRPDLVVGSRGSGSFSACYGAQTAGLTTCSRLTRDPSLVYASSVAVGNVSGSSRPEIVAGVAVYGDKTGGRVETLSLSGAPGSTTVTRSELTQDSAGVRGTNEKGDDFGQSLALGDLDGDAYADLVVGAPGEDKGRGRVTVVYGGATGYRTSGGLVYDQDTKGVPGKAEKNDAFGEQVALLDRAGTSPLDLVVGAPGENGDDGAISVLLGADGAFATKGSRTVSLKDLGYAADKNSRFGDALGR